MTESIFRLLKFKMRRADGFSIVELVVAAAIIVSLVTAAAGAWQLYFQVSRTNIQQTQASLLTEEASEALHQLRDISWNNLAPLTLDTPYYLYWNGARYATSTTPVTVNKAFTVSFALSAVGRDGNSNISTGGANDPHTRSAIITVADATSTQVFMQAPILLHDIFHN